MAFEIRRSDDKKFYYLLDIDDEGNEKFIADSKDLAELKKHESIKGATVKVVDEADTRGKA